MFWKAISPIVVIGIAIAIAVLLWLNRSEPQIQEVKPPVLDVDVALIEKSAVRVRISSQGVVRPKTVTELAAEVSGIVDYVSPNFVAGGFFKQSDLLLRIEDKDYRAAVSRAEAEVAGARSALAIEKGRGEVARRELEETQDELGARNAAGTALALRKPQLKEAQARLTAALANLEQARNDLKRTRVRAPYDGLSRQRLVDLGQYLNVGSPLGSIFATDVAEVRLPLPENRFAYIDLPDFREGRVATPRPEVVLSATIAGSVHSWPAHITRSENVFSEMTQSLYLVAEAQDPYRLAGEQQSEPLRVGTFVQAMISGRSIPDLVVLPHHVLRAGNRLWVVDAQQRLRLRQVESLSLSGAYVYISSGLNSGDLVCLTALGNIIPGSLARVVSKISSGRWARALKLGRNQGR